MKKRNTLKLTEARRLTPPIKDEIADCALALRAAAYNAITESDIVEMMKSVVEKAKQGDVKSIQFVMDMMKVARVARVPQPAPAIPTSGHVIDEDDE